MAAVHSDTPIIKTETSSQYVNGELSLKTEQEPTGAPSAIQPDDDIYEDPGDLDFSNTIQGMYLARIPKFLWENWSKLENDEEIRIGTVRIEGGPEDVKRMSLLLSSDLVQNHDVPKEYNMHLMERSPASTFIFTEKDLPGYSTKAKGNIKPGQHTEGFSSSRIPPHNTFQDRSRQATNQGDKGKRWQPYFRKAIPKKTALAGQIQKEINCLPVENAEYRQLMDRRAKRNMKPKKETKLLTGIVSSHGGNLLAPGTLGPSGNFDTFIKNTGSTRGKPQESKAARIPQNELLDLIYECFKRYTYWPLKSLKAELNQPEAYLKQTLELVAHLIRQGPHAMTWQLKPESKIGAYADAQLYEQVKDEVAPDFGFDGASDSKDPGETLASDEDDDNLKMEDVIPE